MASNKFHSLELSHPIIILFLGPFVDIYLHLIYPNIPKTRNLRRHLDFWGFLGMVLGTGAHLVSLRVGSSDFRFEISARATAGGTVSKYHLQRSSVGCRSGSKILCFPQYIYIYIYMVNLPIHVPNLPYKSAKCLYKKNTIHWVLW